MIMWTRFKAECWRLTMAVTWVGGLTWFIAAMSFYYEDEYTPMLAAVIGLSVGTAMWFILSVIARSAVQSANTWFLTTTPMSFQHYLAVNVRNRFAALSLAVIVAPAVIVWLGAEWVGAEAQSEPRRSLFLINLMLFYAIAFLIPLREAFSGVSRLSFFVFPLRHYVKLLFLSGMLFGAASLAVDRIAGTELQAAAVRVLARFLEIDSIGPLVAGALSPLSGIFMQMTDSSPEWVAFVWTFLLGAMCVYTANEVAQSARKSTHELESLQFQEWVEGRDEFIDHIAAVEFESEQKFEEHYAGRPTLDLDSESTGNHLLISPRFVYRTDVPAEELLVAANELFRERRIGRWAKGTGLVTDYFWWFAVGTLWMFYFYVSERNAIKIAPILFAVFALVAGNAAFRLRTRLRMAVVCPLRWTRLMASHMKYQLRMAAIPDAFASALLAMVLDLGVRFGVSVFVTCVAIRAWSCVLLQLDAHERAGMKFPYRLNLLVNGVVLLLATIGSVVIIGAEKYHAAAFLIGGLGPALLMASSLIAWLFRGKTDSSVLGVIQPRAAEISDDGFLS